MGDTTQVLARQPRNMEEPISPFTEMFVFVNAFPPLRTFQQCWPAEMEIELASLTITQVDPRFLHRKLDFVLLTSVRKVISWFVVREVVRRYFPRLLVGKSGQNKGGTI